MRTPAAAKTVIAACVCYEQSSAAEHNRNLVRELRLALQTRIWSGLSWQDEAERARRIVDLLNQRHAAAYGARNTTRPR